MGAVSMGRGAHTSEETQGGPVLHPEGLWRHPPPTAHHSLSLSLEPSALRPSSRLCLSHPAQARPPFFTVTIYSSFLLFVRNGHKNQCKTISVGVLFYITKNSS